MPRVPKYGGLQVERRPLPGVRRGVVSPVGEGLAQLGEQATQIAAGVLQGIQVRNDRAEQQKAHNDLAERRLQLVLSARDIKGEDAFDLQERYEREFEDFASGIETKIKNRRVRASFQALRASELGALRIGVASHVSGERERFYAEQHVRGAELALSDVIANAEDTDLRNRAFRVGEAKTRDGLAGQAPETIAAGVLEFRTKAHVGVVNRLLALGQNDRARQYFEEAKSEIQGTALPGVERAIQEGTTLGEAQRQSDAIIRTGGTLTEQRDKAKQIDDPEVRQRALTLIEHEANVRESIARANEEDLMVTAGNLIDQGGLRAVPATVWAKLTPSQKTNLEEYARRKQSGDSSSDLVVYYRLMQQASTSPDEFAKANLLTYLGKLGKTEFKQLTELQNRIRKGDEAQANEQLAGFRTNDQIFQDTIVPAGIEPGTKAAARLRRALDERVDALQALTGKKATNSERQLLADDLLTTVFFKEPVLSSLEEKVLRAFPGSWAVLPHLASGRTTSKPLYELTIDDVPQTDRQQIVEALQRRGRPVTNDSILTVFIAHKRRTGQIK